MGLWDRIFSKKQQFPEPDDSPPPAEREAFYELIARDGVWLIAKELSDRGMKLVDYVDESGQHIFPLFSTQGTAATWVRQSGVKAVTPFPCVQLSAEWLITSVPSGAQVVFDQRSPYERVMAQEDLALLKQLVTATERSTK